MPRRQLSHRRALLVILGMAFAVRLIVVVAALRDPEIPPSTDNYVRMAQDWLADGYYSDAEWPPVYTALCRLLLVTVGEGPIFHILLALHVLWGTAAVWFVWRIACLLGLEARVGLTAAGIAALEPSAVIHTGLALTETLYVFMLTGSVWALLESVQAGESRGPGGCRRRGLLAGIGMGIGSLVRFVGLPVAVVLGAWTVFTGPREDRRRRVMICLLLLAPVAIVNLAWAVRNYVDMGYFEVHSAGGHNLAVMFVGPARVMHEGLPVDSYNCLYIWPPEELGEDWDSPSKFAQSHGMARAAVRWALAHPLDMVGGLVRSGVMLWFGPGRAPWEKITGLDPLPLWMTGGLYLAHFALAVLTLVGLVFWWNGQPECRAGLGLVVLMIFVHQASLGCSGYNRYLVPIVPFAALLAAVAILDGGRKLRASIAHVRESGWLEPEPRPKREAAARDEKAEDFGLRGLITGLGQAGEDESEADEKDEADSGNRQE